MVRIPQPDAKGYEKAVVHPAVANWLTSQNYTWQYEYDTGDGFIDFLATHPELGTLIVECKSDCKSIQSTVMQVLYYSRLLKDQCSTAIAVPSNTVTQPIIDKLERLGIMLVTVDVIDQKTFIPRSGDSDNDLRIPLIVCLAQIQIFHSEQKTLPTSDYLNLGFDLSIVYPEHEHYIAKTIMPYIKRAVGSYDPSRSWFDTSIGKGVFCWIWS